MRNRAAGKITVPKIPLVLVAATVGIICVIAPLFPVASGLAQQTDRQTNVSVEGPRPLAALLQILESRYGWPISYEDPRFAYSEDVVDETDPVYAKEHPGARALRIKGGVLSVDNSLLTTLAGDPGALIQRIADLNAAAGFPIFKVIQGGEFFHVVPKRVRDGHGRWIQQDSILDAPISLLPMRTSALEGLKAIVGAVSEAAKVEVNIGNVPFNLLTQTQCELEARNEVARDVLARILREAMLNRPIGFARRLSWRLLYDPGAQLYLLNIHRVGSSGFDGPGGR